MHQVNDLVISCMDFRFRPKIAEWIKNSLNDQADLVILAGASKAILDDDTQASMLKQIGLGEKLHTIKTVHIIDHIDCGAYGGSAKFNNKDDETTTHKDTLNKAEEIVKKSFPDLEVKKYIIDFDHIEAC